MFVNQPLVVDCVFSDHFLRHSCSCRELSRCFQESLPACTGCTSAALQISAAAAVVVASRAAAVPCSDGGDRSFVHPLHNYREDGRKQQKCFCPV